MSYSVSGSYFESCNCDPICPCRMVDGVVGGRSTYGICKGVLAWSIEDGRVEELDVSGLLTALVIQYDDDEPGSPWTIVLHVDERARAERHEAVGDVFIGRLGPLLLGIAGSLRRAGAISPSIAALDRAVAVAPGNTSARRQLEATTDEAAVLQGEWAPPQVSAGRFRRHRGRVLHFVGHSAPHSQAGYTVRT